LAKITGEVPKAKQFFIFAARNQTLYGYQQGNRNERHTTHGIPSSWELFWGCP
jgi:hypothetical protein